MRWLPRLGLGVLVEGLLLLLALYWSWWLTLFVVLGILVAASVRYFDKIGGAVGVSIVAVCILLGLGKWGVLPLVARSAPNGLSESSCDEMLIEQIQRNFPGFGGKAGPPPLQQSPLAGRRVEMERDAARYLYQAKAAIDVDATLTAVSRTLDLQSAPGLEDARTAVNDGAQSIRGFLNDKGLSGREARMKSYEALKTVVDTVLQSASKAVEAEDIRGLESNLFEADNRSDISQLAKRMFSLEEALLALTRQAVTTSSEYSIQWDASSSVATYREIITIASLQDALLDTIDASLLVREGESAGSSVRIGVQKGDETPAYVSDPEHILVQPRSRQVKIMYDRAAPVSRPTFCSSAPMSTIQRANFIWPSSAPSVRLTGDIARGEQHLPVRVLHDRSKAETQTLESISLPASSVFAAARPLTLATRDGADVLTASKPDDLALRNFTAERNDWIEVFSDTVLLRNGVIQRFKNYLIVENAVAAILTSVLAAAEAA
jgi:hypothetical protein